MPLPCIDIYCFQLPCIDIYSSLRSWQLKFWLLFFLQTLNIALLANRLEQGYQDSSNNETQTPTPVILPETEVNEERATSITVRARGYTQSQYDLRDKLATNMQESGSQPVDGKKKRKMDTKEVEDQTEVEHTQTEQTQPASSNQCNLQSICRVLKDTKLNDRHIASLKKTPFWLLFEAIMNRKLLSDNCRKYDEVVLRIIQSYEEESRSFIVGDRQLKLTMEHVKLIFGISCGEVQMMETNAKKESVTLAKRLKIKEPRLSAPAMKQKIKELTSTEKEQDVEDVVRLLCLYLCVTLFFSNQGTTVNWSYVQHMEGLEKAKQYDWAEAIRKYLLMSVHNNHKELKGLKGSTVLLLVQETAEERKIFDEIYGDHGDKQGQVSEDHQGEQGGTKVIDDGQTIGVMATKLVDDEQEQVEPMIGVVHGGEQVGICGKEEGEKGGVQVSEDDGGEQVQVSEKVQGLDDFDSPICRPFEIEDNLFATDSGSTLSKAKKNANGLIDELKNKIEKLEKEKQNIEIEMIKNQAQNEKALQSQKEENGMLKQRNQAVEKQVAELQKMNDNLQNGNKMLLKEKEHLEVKVKDLEAKVQDFEIHQLTQAYPMETEREVHQVTQRATFEKIARLQKEKNDMEDELACIAVHKITQEAAKEKKKLNEQCSPRSMFKRVITRDDRKKNYSEDYVYGQVKRKSPQLNPIDVDDGPDYNQQQKRKRKKLKVNTEVDTIDVDKSSEYEQREKGEKEEAEEFEGECGTVVMESPWDNLHVELLDIENLLFEDPISNRVIPILSSCVLKDSISISNPLFVDCNCRTRIDANALLLMRQHIETQLTFDLNTQPPKSYIFISCFMVKHYTILSYSVDCGIVVMSITRKYIENESQTSAMTRHECRQIRADLIDLFLNQEVHMAGVTSV
ncbi:hypothetical protein RHSIM_Rhsim12G0117400 [Rhododendron simsii]|uniref:Uncharacterized protein n=1 Tax=Rhododendron simsii TaxID=118357 RepID=A0A834G8C0_RHOSS|nr:hypothetical protein RHSIM_Rhsim12G0117400 [Rhododendron simsii]